MKANVKNIFNQIMVNIPKSNVFNLTHDVKMSFKMGELTPTMWRMCYPGDLWNIGCESMIRFAPLLAPVMHRFDITMHYFFVPLRILWPNWEKYWTNTKVGEPEALPVHPYFGINAAAVGSFGSAGARLSDYLGLPVQNCAAQPAVTENVSAFPFAAYTAIWNDWYRDQNLINEYDYELTDGNNTVLHFDNMKIMRRRAWEHDYFTSCLPFAQKGDAVDIPLGTVELDMSATGSNIVRRSSDRAVIADESNLQTETGGILTSELLGSDTASVIDPNGQWIVGATTINDFRLAEILQKYLELNARGGTRYVEMIKAHYGVRSSDARLQRPEYVTGVKSPVMISEVLNTTGTAEAPQGAMAGHAVGVTSGKYGRFFCEEHGIMMGIATVMPKTAYQQGIHKEWLYINEPTEYPLPLFANIGEQPVLNREIYAWQAGGAGANTFGYNPRFAEAKFADNRTAGDFKVSLDYWTGTRIFATPPALNQAFIECNPDTRIFAVEDGTDYLWAQILHKISVMRKLPVFGTPTIK